MSMRDYAYADYGLILDTETIQHMYAKAINDPIELEDMAYALYEKGIVEYAGEFTGEAFFIEDDGYDDWRNSITYGCDVLYYVPFKSNPSLFKAAYNNIDEIINELKEKVGQYMPDGYDYRANIRHIMGTTWG